MRDAYDVVSCFRHEPHALEELRACLQPSEHQALEYDATIGEIQISTAQPLLEPAYTHLANPKALREALFAALNGTLEREQATTGQDFQQCTLHNS